MSSMIVAESRNNKQSPKRRKRNRNSRMKKEVMKGQASLIKLWVRSSDTGETNYSTSWSDRSVTRSL